MSFYKQPLTYQCGPFALKYALVMLGQMADVKKIEQRAGSTWWYGTNELGLKKAARYYDCDFVELTPVYNELDSIVTKLNKYLEQNIPVVICVDKWSHWIAVVSHEDNKYICVDSGMKKVIIVLTEYELKKRWLHIENKVSYYSGYAVVPKYSFKSRAKFAIADVKILMSDLYEDLALNWDSYYMVLSDIARPKNANANHTMTFREFLRRNQTTIASRIADWHGDVDRKELDQILENFAFVARVYNLVIHEKDEKAALVNFTCVLTMYATYNYDIDSYI